MAGLETFSIASGGYGATARKGWQGALNLLPPVLVADLLYEVGKMRNDIVVFGAHAVGAIGSLRHISARCDPRDLADPSTAVAPTTSSRRKEAIALLMMPFSRSWPPLE